MIDLKQYLEEEWETESLDSVIFNLGYEKEKQNEYKNLFINHFLEISTLRKVSFSEINKYDQYNGENLDELKNNTAYMKKDIDYLLNHLDELPPPLFIYKNNKLQILGGRTRTSILRILGKKDIEAYVIDYQKMLPYFSKIREQEILTYGYDIFSIEDNKSLNASLLSAARDIREGMEINLSRIKNKIKILEESDDKIKKIIYDMSKYLYGEIELNTTLEEAKELIEKHNKSKLNSITQSSHNM